MVSDFSSVTGPLRPIQFNILTKWHKECRNKKDLIIKLHTGAGKTLVGLLIALSYINNGEGPVVYVCPNIYLMQQACLNAQKFGIPFCIINKDNQHYPKSIESFDFRCFLVAKIPQIIASPIFSSSACTAQRCASRSGRYSMNFCTAGVRCACCFIARTIGR